MFYFLILTAILKAIQDLQAHGKLGLAGAWWNANSWQLKWKHGNPKQGERFPGSSTVLVWTTDAWHCFGMLRHVSMVLAIVCYTPLWTWWIDAGVLLALHSVVFHLYYTYIPKLYECILEG